MDNLFWYGTFISFFLNFITCIFISNFLLSLFKRYVLTTLHQLIANEYIMIYFNGGTSSNNNMPTFNFLRRCYYMIDRKLRKSLKALYLVHPTLWLKGIVVMTRPFIKYVSLLALKTVITLTYL